MDSQNVIDKVNLISNTIRSDLSIDSIIRYIRTHIIRIVLVILMILFYRKIKGWILRFIEKILNNMFKHNKTLVSFIQSLVKALVDIILIVVILQLLGLNLNSIAELVIGLSIVIGFALKELLSNFIGGIILLTTKPFVSGDVISYNGYSGTVKCIEILYTKLTSFFNEEIIIPNSQLTSKEVTNINKNVYRLLKTSVGVSYDSDIEKVKKLLYDIIESGKNEYFLVDDKFVPLVGMNEIASSTLNFDIRVYVKLGQYLKAKFYLNEQIIIRFAKENINIPYNILDVQITKEVKSES